MSDTDISVISPHARSKLKCELDKELGEAAKTGDVRLLHKLIEEDSKILDNKDPFADTILHIAARHGKAIFAVEVAIFKPCFTRKLNPTGLTPLHEALKAKQWETASALAALDGELIREKGSRGKTALHVAAEIAPQKLLAEFLYICPASLEDVTSRWETAVHCALKNEKFENFMVLFKWMVTTRKEYLLEWKDFNGNTALHLAAAKRWKEGVKIVVQYVPKESKNFKGHTAAQVLVKPGDVKPGELPRPHDHTDDKEITALLSRFNVLHLIKGHFVRPTITKNLKRTFWLIVWLRSVGFPLMNNEDSEKSRDAVLPVATLIATATYQAILAPPGGYWQGSSSSPPAHSEGQLIMQDMKLFSFSATNAVAFCIALASIVLNVVQLKQAVLLTVATYVLLFNYMYTIVLSMLLGTGWKWGDMSTWKLTPALLLPSILLPSILALAYACIGFYVALNNKCASVMDSCKRKNVPVMDGYYGDEDDGKEEEEEEEEEKLKCRSIP